MKFFVAIALVATMASAAIIKPTAVSGELAQIQEVIAAIQSPSTDPATAAALEQMLLDLAGINVQPEPVIVGPALVEYEPVSVGPAIVDFPLPDGGAVAENPAVVEPSPVVVGELEAGQASPLIQIIVNVNQASASPVGAAPTPAESAIVDAAEPIIIVDQAAEPVHVVDQAAEPVHVVDQVAEPVIVVDTPTVLEPVQVVEPVVVEPVVIGTPIIPAPAVVLPENLN